MNPIRPLLRAAALALVLVGGASLAGAAPEATAPADLAPADGVAEPGRLPPQNHAPFWRAVREGTPQPDTTTTVSGREAAVLIQPFAQYPGAPAASAGEAWRQVRNDRILPWGAALLGITALAIALFWWRRGPIGAPMRGEPTIERFGAFERAAHWSNAIAFVVLAVSGLVMAFGKFFLLPVLGPTLFGWLSYALKTAHNFAGPLFAVSLVVVFVTFVRSNLPRREDWTWLRRGGGLLGGHAPASHRFNAGEKIVFWLGVLLLGGLVVASGLVLDGLLPGGAPTRGAMQIAHMAHAVGAIAMLALFAGHIYMGTVGMRGAYRAMRDGRVDAAWAEEHHALWYEDVKAGRIAAPHAARPQSPRADAPMRA